ncbi:flavin reductase family protein [Aquabacter cavernae]|uniref:flavin reductase family protein n=1 Tax=Aquabacter cavernae TaxID=2496029 RepID=UPI000F8EE2B9|nr:flavin reductase family protein [Aquabacter cavernae]
MTVQAHLKEAMSRYPSGVVIVTMRDRDRTPRGFTASSFTSVSMNPPMVLICLAEGAECHPHFVSAETFAVSVLRPEHKDLALTFAKRGEDKFATEALRPNAHGLDVVEDAVATLVCRTREAIPCGDHTVILGEVQETALGDPGPALAYHQRAFVTVG